MSEKQCPQCKETKTIAGFYPNSSTPDGVDGYCKACRKEYNAEKLSVKRGVRARKAAVKLNMTPSRGRGKLTGARTLIMRALQDVADAWPLDDGAGDMRFLKHNLAMAAHGIDTLPETRGNAMSPNGDGIVPGNLNGDDWMAEIEALRDSVTSPGKINFTETQDRALWAARMGEPPVPWPKLCEWWQARGWPGCENTLRRRFREMAEQERGK